MTLLSINGEVRKSLRVALLCSAARTAASDLPAVYYPDSLKTHTLALLHIHRKSRLCPSQRHERNKAT
jgi:hypothetical protein